MVEYGGSAAILLSVPQDWLTACQRITRSGIVAPSRAAPDFTLGPEIG